MTLLVICMQSPLLLDYSDFSRELLCSGRYTGQMNKDLLNDPRNSLQISQTPRNLYDMFWKTVLQMDNYCVIKKIVRFIWDILVGSLSWNYVKSISISHYWAKNMKDKMSIWLLRTNLNHIMIRFHWWPEQNLCHVFFSLFYEITDCTIVNCMWIIHVSHAQSGRFWIFYWSSFCACCVEILPT